VISNQDLADALMISSQRVNALMKTIEVGTDESILKGRNRYYKRSAVRKMLRYRGLDFNIEKRIAISNNKGGVGKTSIATALAKRLTDLGFDVLLIDIDPQANSTSSLLKTERDLERIRGTLYNIVRDEIAFNDAIIELEDGLNLLPSNLSNSRLESELTTLKKNPLSYVSQIIGGAEANFIIFDMSPSFSQINYLCTLACNMVIIPTLLTKFSIEGVQMTLDSLNAWHQEFPSFAPDVRILVNQMDNRFSTQLSSIASLERAVQSYASQGLSAEMMRTVIRSDSTVNKFQSGASKSLDSSNFYSDIKALAQELGNFSSIYNQKLEV